MAENDAAGCGQALQEMKCQGQSRCSLPRSRDRVLPVEMAPSGISAVAVLDS